MEANPPRADETWPFVREVVRLDEVDSTSDHARRLLLDSTPALPLCVLARRQTRGRGRGTHNWWSDPGSLTFTVAIDPAAHGLARESEPSLALATAVAVIEAVGDLGLDVPGLGIRWPNDIEAGGRKLGGILPERLESAEGARVLIGVGLNVATDPAAMPDDVRRMATSLAELRGDPAGGAIPPALLPTILARFESVLGLLASRDPALPDRWNRLDLLRDEWVSVNLGGRIIAGRGEGIDADGTLIVEAAGARRRLSGGQVLR